MTLASAPEIPTHAKPRLRPRNPTTTTAVFEGRSCCRCEAPAARLVADRFLCPAHFALLKRDKEVPRPTRVYCCAAWNRG